MSLDPNGGNPGLSVHEQISMLDAARFAVGTTSPTVAKELLEKLKANEVRADKVADIRARLEDGTYESDAMHNRVAGEALDDLE
ncbi:MAG TPA: flagellar biosynthesis anti-sigma factor FlgM [Candidatus Paceibacterota bacterium]|nr:flagellar biosynthesis anti-sigma factor FlgM [Candidatus Paceibacterota bacterium]